jgi:hypothetical protein
MKKGMVHPSVWAPAFWQTMHSAALGYPERPSELQKAVYRSFFVNIGDVIPCATCSDGYRRLLRREKGALGTASEGIPTLDEALDAGGEALFVWSVAVHRAVSRELGKPDADRWTPVRARAAVLAWGTNQKETRKTQEEGETTGMSMSFDVWSIAALTVALAVGFLASRALWEGGKFGLRCGLRLRHRIFFASPGST